MVYHISQIPSRVFAFILTEIISLGASFNFRISCSDEYYLKKNREHLAIDRFKIDIHIDHTFCQSTKKANIIVI